MSMTNCVNCGASKEVSDLQCPFCGTKYADLSTLELFSNKPLFLQFRGRNGDVTTAKAYITNTTLNIQPQVTCLYGGDSMIRRHVSSMNITGSIDFELYEKIWD